MNDKSPSPTREDLADRLIDLALSEKVGGRQPPDLSAQILARAQDKASLPEVRPAPALRERPAYWSYLVSGCLLALAMLCAVVLRPEVVLRPLAHASLPQGVKSPSKTAPLTELEKQDKLVQLVDEFNTLIDQQRFANAEVVARQAQELDPESAVADFMAEKARLLRQMKEGYPLASFATPSMNNMEGSPIVYPDANVWEELTIRRKKYSAVDGKEIDPSFRDREFSTRVAEIDAGLMGSTLRERQNRLTDLVKGYKKHVDVRGSFGNELNVSDPMLPLDGEVTAVSPKNGRLVELSIGADDGLRVGHALNVYREGGQVLMGGLKVVKTSPDRAIAVLVDGFERDRIMKGDKVATPNNPPGDEPDPSGDKFNVIPENDFEKVTGSPLSTFSIDVDTASYSKVRQFLLHANQLPPPEAVRLEELINYFPYGYAPPADEKPFAAHVEVAVCPWKPEHRLVRIGLKGKVIEETTRPACNLVFLVDVSGSMNEANRLPLVIQSLKALAGELAERDRVSIVVYAGAAGMVLPPTSGDAKPTIFTALTQLQAGGSTNGEQGIELAYKTAQENFIEGGVNRVILCTDGDFNVGTTSTGELVELAKDKAQRGVFLSVLGFGMGNHNDEMLEAVSNKANGNYAFIDTLSEARKVLVRQINGTLVTIAKDVKIQVEFNPNKVASYRLLGYENRMLAAADFNDDKKDAGEIGGGHTVTALYEIVPAGVEKEPAAKQKLGAPKTAGEAKGDIDELKYQPEGKLAPADAASDLLTLKLRYKEPEGEKSTKLEFPVKDVGRRFTEASPDFQFASAVASFGMLLRHSRHKGEGTFDAVIETASAAKGEDPHGYRAEFVELVKKAAELSKK